MACAWKGRWSARSRAKLLILMYSDVMIKTQNDASNKAWIFMPSMMITWMDEMNRRQRKRHAERTLTRQHPAGHLQPRRIGMHTVYKVGKKKGDSDMLVLRNIDARGFFIVNNQNPALNGALRSRFDMEETYQEAKTMTGRKNRESSRWTLRVRHPGSAAAVPVEAPRELFYHVASVRCGSSVIDFQMFDTACVASYLVPRDTL